MTDIAYTARKMMKMHGFENIPIILTNAQRTMGAVKYIRDTKEVLEVRFSHVIGTFPKPEFEDVILHEIAHMIDVKTRGYSAHDHVWKQIAKRIGAEPTRTTNAGDGPTFNYVVVCEGCKKPLAYRIKLTKRFRHKIAHSRCASCGCRNLSIVNKKVKHQKQTQTQTQKPAPDPKTVKPKVVDPYENMESPSETFSVQDLSKEFGIPAKKLRIKIRKLKNELPQPIQSGRWVWEMKYRTDVIKKIVK